MRTTLAGNSTTHWSTDTGSMVVPAHPLEDPRLNLFAWQEEAFEAWVGSGYRGIVEAVTGAGKTRLGLAAISAAAREGRQTLLLVPTIELLNQWYGEIRALLPWVRVGRLGNQHRDNFLTHEVIVSTVQSTIAMGQRAAGGALSGSSSRLLIADEVHRLGAEQFAKVLDERCPWRLGLTATYERPDEQHLERLDPYFGGVIFKLWYDRAQADHLIAPFDVALVGVDLEPQELAEYKDLSVEIGKAHRALRGYLVDETLSGSQFLKLMALWASSEEMSARTSLARRYMQAVSKRQRLLAQSQAKLDQLPLLTPALQESRSTLIFSLTKQGAEEAAACVADQGIVATAVFSDVSAEDRDRRMRGFRSGAIPVLSAPRVLDEGVDVPEAALGIVLAANRSKRQLVQRLGRVIRRKPDGRAGKFVFFYANETIEDPNEHGDEHLNEILPHARNLSWFDLPGDAADLLVFLENVPPSEPAPSPAPGRTPHRTLDPAAPRPEATPLAKNPTTPGSPRPASAPDPAASPDPVLRPELGGHPGLSSEGVEPEELEPEAWDGEVPERLKGQASLGRDSVNQYLKQIGQYELLSAEEEVDLGKQIECGVLAQERLHAGCYQLRRERRELEQLVKDGGRAHQKFVCANLRLVVSIAKKYMHGAGSLELLDLVQEGNFGLERAVQKWDFRHGTKFSTYGTWWIRQSITRAMADLSRTVRLPVHVVERLTKVRGFYDEHLQAEGDEEAAQRAAAQQADMPLDDVVKLLGYDRRLASLDAPSWLVEVGRYELTHFGARIFDEHAGEIEEGLIRTDAAEALERILWLLDDRSQEVIRMRMGIPEAFALDKQPEPQTLDAIGERFGVTRERIRQIETQAKNLIRDRYSPRQLRELLAY